MKAIRCGRLWTGLDDQPAPDTAVLVDDRGVISAVEKWNAQLASSHDGLDWSDYVVIPGLIDCHDHLGLDLGDEAEQAREPDAWTAVRAVRNARTILAAGITTLRNAGEKNYIDVLFRDAISQGLMSGPRLLICGRVITRTGGHAYYLAREADGPDDVRRAVREQVRAGADFVKAMITGGIGTKGSDPTESAYTADEIGALVGEAHRLGRTVAAHAYGGAGARDAVAAGLDSLEHGTYLGVDDLKLMSERGTRLVVTYGVMRVGAESDDAPAFMREKLKRALDAYLETVRNAKQANVGIAIGGDCVHGRPELELGALVEAGFTPVEALRAATIEGARLCRLQDRVGTIEPGKCADLVALRQDPLQSVSNITSVQFVMKEGRVQSP
jgi:imidazolonepropionase-like amidohydrolase